MFSKRFSEAFCGDKYVKLHIVIPGNRTGGSVARVRYGKWGGGTGSEDLLCGVPDFVYRQLGARTRSNQGLTRADQFGSHLMKSVDTSFKWALYAQLARLRTELRARELQRPSFAPSN